MSNEQGRTSGEEALPKRPSARTVRESVPESAQPVLGDRIAYVCQSCNHEADATYRIDRYTKKPTWFVGNAFTTRCPRRGECLKLHCEWLAELGIEVTPEQLLTDPRPALGAAGAKASRNDRPPPPLPGRAQIDGWAARLLANPDPLRYLTDERGLTLEVIEAARIGFDGERLTFPMFHEGELVAFKRREPREGGQMRSFPGGDRDWPLYPGAADVASVFGWVLLLAGELDALAGRSVDLPAASVTPGAGTWRDAWTDELRGIYVLVAFDNNETALAQQRASELREAGIRARHLDLRTLGLTTPKGDLSDYLNSGGDPKRIKPPGRRTK
jgi:hypothetical protein